MVCFRIKWIIGPFFFEDEDHQAVTVNQDTYLQMLKLQYMPALRRRGLLDTTVFMQDGASPHTARRVLEFLREKFPDRLISLKTDQIWPPHSPDLNPLDFYLWGYLKSVVYQNRPRTTEELKRNIKREVRRIRGDVLMSVIENFLCRLQYVHGKQGAWIEHVMNYTSAQQPKKI